MNQDHRLAAYPADGRRLAEAHNADRQGAEDTNGAMTILINRRNRSVSSVMSSAQAETVVGVA